MVDEAAFADALAVVARFVLEAGLLAGVLLEVFLAGDFAVVTRRLDVFAPVVDVAACSPAFFADPRRDERVAFAPPWRGFSSALRCGRTTSA